MKKRVISILFLFNFFRCAAGESYDPEFISWCLQTKEPACQPYSPIISLGINCQAAYQMRIHGLRYEAFPFDWIICPFDALIALIDNDFENFLEPKYLTYIHTEKAKHIVNTLYDIKFLHDFRLNESFMEDYEKIREMYERRIERFYQRMGQSSRALLIRRKITKSQAVQLKQLLKKKFPQTHFLIVAVDNTQEIKTDWHIEGILNYYMPISAAQTWKGDSILWGQLFSLLNLTISYEEPKDALFKSIAE